MAFKTNSWIAWPIQNYKITAFITALFLAFGIWAMYVMPKDEFPAFTIRQGVVIAVMPGATAEEIEEQVARPLERYIFTYKEVNRSKTYSTSQNGMCIVMVEFQDDQNNLTPVWSKMKHGLNNFKSSLPKGVVALVVQDDFGDTSALLITVESDQRSYRELQGYSDELADRLRRLPSVSKVQQLGEKKEQLTICVDRERLAAYGIGQSALIQALTSQGLTTMSGTLSTPQKNLNIHVAPSISSEQEISERIILTTPDGKTVRVRDIASVQREDDLSDSYIESNGKRCVILSLEMLKGNNIVMFGEDVDEILDQFRQDCLPEDVQMRRITDQPEVVGTSVSDFLRDLLISMVIIVAVMIVLFPIRSAMVAALTIPLSTFVSTGIMYAMGIELNIITLACLIVVLGMIVDNSIVVIDGYLEYLGKGMGRREAAVKSVQQYFWPMLLATVCICAIFYPILLTLKGEAADVLRLFPLTITINLMVSLVVAAVIIPLLNVAIIRKVKEKVPGKRDITDWVQDWYDKTLEWNFRHPWLTIVGSIVLVVATGALFPLLKMRQFPFADRNQFAVEVYLPEGSGLEETKKIADELNAILKANEKVTGVTSFVGCSSPRFHTTYAPVIAGKNFAQLIVNTESNEASLEILDQLAPKYSNHWPNAYVRWKQMDYLPVPTYEYRFYGNNIDSTQKAADMLMQEMRTIPELEWVHTDYDRPSPLVEVSLDPVASSQLGISRTSAELQLMLQTGKMQIGSIWEAGSVDGKSRTYEVPLVLKDRATEQMTFSDVDDTYLSTATGASVPLRQVAGVAPRWGHTKIVHRNGERCISVTAEGKRGTFALDIQNRIIDYIGQMPLPRGVRAEVGGETEENNDITPDVMAGLGMAVVLIFFFLLFNFRKFSIATVCIVAISLGMPGAIVGLLIANKILGLTSLFGFITLMGMIMRNEILIFEHANEKMAAGMSAKEAAFDAGKRRMVPIFLTTATTAVGVVPMIIAGSSFWMPVGITIFAGGIGMLLLVTTVLPVVYWKLYEKKEGPSGPTPNPSTREGSGNNQLGAPSAVHPTPLHRGRGLGVGLFFFCCLAMQAQPRTLSLEECLQNAATRNRTLQNAALEIQKTGEQKKEAFTKYFPEISANVMAFHAFDKMVKADGYYPQELAALGQINPQLAALAGQPFSVREMDQAYAVMGMVTQPLFAGGQIVNGNRLAAIGQDVAELQMELQTKDILQKVTENYYQIVKLKLNQATVSAAQAQLRAIYKEVQTYVDAGVTTRNDLLRVRLELQRLSSDSLTLSNAHHVMCLLLAQQIGLAGEQVDVSLNLPTSSENPIAYYIEPRQALASRQELAMAQKGVEAGKLKVRMEVGKHLPTVAVGLALSHTGIGGLSQGTKSMMDNTVNNGMVFGTVSVPLTAWWGGAHAIRREKLALRQADNQLQDAREQLIIDIEASWSSLVEAYKQIDIAATSVEEATENMRMSLDKYRMGTEILSDLLDSETLLRESQNRLAQAQADYMTKRADYLRKTR
ncbi:MAG: efflux RND transporter permease subunit [Bacteroidaceae bacterium]|nr:efflux RND transporter permease subunit [Bacteroidaceae bacterium]